MYKDKVKTVKAQEFRRHLEAFRSYVRSRDLSPKTIQTYDEALRRFQGWLVGTHGEEADITARCIREFAAHRLAEGKRPLTVRAELTALRAFFSFLIFDEAINENPMRLVVDPKGPLPEIVPLSHEQIHRLLDSFDREVSVEWRNYVICLLILDTGLRVSEIARLRLDDLKDSRIKIQGKGRKSRTVFMGRKMGKVLGDYIERCRPEICDGHGTLFPPSTRSTYPTMRPHYVSEIIRKKMDEAGIPRCNSSGHRLRHSFATMYIRNGGDVFSLQRLLGHSKLEMTQRYVTLNQEDLARAHRRASPIDNMNSNGESGNLAGDTHNDGK